MTERQTPKPQEIYRHFKDESMLYQIITLAVHSETGEKMVVYQALYGDYKVYVRPLDMFMSTVDREQYPESDAVYRFTKAEPEKLSVSEKAAKHSEKNKNGDTVVTDTSQNIRENSTADEQTGEISMDLLNFLEADSYEEQRSLLVQMRPRMTDRLIDDIAASMDVAVEEGDVETRFLSLMKCIQTKQKYEIMNR